MKQLTWLALGYQVPVNPSKNRVYVWRKLKEFGAGYFKQGVAILPKNTTSIAQFRKLAQKIREMGGEATLAELRFCDKRDETETIARFQRQSTGEYQKLIDDIVNLRNSISENRDSGGQDYVKRVAKRYGQVRSRDYFMSRKQPDISNTLDELIADMAHATGDLGKYLARILEESD